MDSWDVMLLVADAVALAVAWAAPRTPGPRLIVLAAPAAALAQLVADGFRWQLVPAQVVAVAVPVLVLARRGRAGRRGTGSSRVGRLAVGGLAVLVGALVAVAPLAVPVFSFPTPTGPYSIGTVTYDWTDTARHEVFDPDPAARRRLLAQVWYPASDPGTGERDVYVPDAAALSARLSALTGMPPFVLSHFDRVHTHAIPGAPPAAGGRFPVLVYATGMYGVRQVSTFQVEELVSHGYVVVGLDQPYTAATVLFPDGHRVDGAPRDRLQELFHQSIAPAADPPVVAGTPMPGGLAGYLGDDLRFAVDRMIALDRADPDGRFTGRLDPARSGALGVSLGGIAVAEACRTDPRFAACLVMEVSMPADVVRDGPRAPTMWITREADSMRLERSTSGGWAEEDIAEHRTTMRAAFARARARAYFVDVRGMYHVDLTDAPSWSPLAGRLGFGGTLGAERVHGIVNAYSLAFFDKHLKRAAGPLLDGPPRGGAVHLEARG